MLTANFFPATNLYFVGVNIFLCLQFLLLVATTKYFNNKNFLLVVTSISTGHLHVFVKLLAIEWSIKFLVTQFSLVIFVVKFLSKFFWLQQSLSRREWTPLIFGHPMQSIMTAWLDSPGPNWTPLPIIFAKYFTRLRLVSEHM